MIVLALVAISVAVTAWIMAMGTVSGVPRPHEYLGDTADTMRCKSQCKCRRSPK